MIEMIIILAIGALLGASIDSAHASKEMDRLRQENAMLKTALQRKENVNY